MLNSPRIPRGVSLLELLVSLVIISLLASVALPYAEITVRRDKEIELRQSLRQIRTAIDRFHEDWKAGRITPETGVVSVDGYPQTLKVLVEGVDLADATGTRRYYLRRIPRDPFADQEVEPADQWVLRSYQDDPETLLWGGRDVFDVRTGYTGTAIDGSSYSDW